MEQDYIKESLKIKEFLDEMLLDKESNVVEFRYKSEIRYEDNF